jgi:SAM-dependent methyltransferase
MGFIRLIRRQVQNLDRYLSKYDTPIVPEPPAAPRRLYEEIKAFLRTVDAPNADALAYWETHIERIARTLSMVPPPGKTKRVLELGAYMQMTPVLQCVLGYEEVRGAYFGPLGRVDTKTVNAGGKEIFRCFVDLFNAEKDRFPYEDARFDTVLACEIIEHLLQDPMFMLLEINRVLVDGGTLVLTTPNIASFTAVMRLLETGEHPQLYSMYPNPFGEYKDTEIPHVREYTPQELAAAVKAAGFDIEYLFTEKIAGYDANFFMRPVLERNGYSAALRGEQIYLIAKKRAGAEITRYPAFLYEGC